MVRGFTTKIMNDQFTTMLYNNRHLIIRKAPDKNPLVICECYLPGTAELICRLLEENELQNKSEQHNETEKSTRI
jgi:hypothetical protein